MSTLTSVNDYFGGTPPLVQKWHSLSLSWSPKNCSVALQRTLHCADFIPFILLILFSPVVVVWGFFRSLWVWRCLLLHIPEMAVWDKHCADNNDGCFYCHSRGKNWCREIRRAIHSKQGRPAQSCKATTLLILVGRMTRALMQDTANLFREGPGIE